MDKLEEMCYCDNNSKSGMIKNEKISVTWVAVANQRALKRVTAMSVKIKGS